MVHQLEPPEIIRSRSKRANKLKARANLKLKNYENRSAWLSVFVKNRSCKTSDLVTVNFGIFQDKRGQFLNVRFGRWF